MEITLKYFAWVRERIGKAEEEVHLPDQVKTVEDAIEWLKGRGEEYAAAFEHADVIRAAVDLKHAQKSTLLSGAREVAFFPPITGG